MLVAWGIFHEFGMNILGETVREFKATPFWQWVQSLGFVTQSAHFFAGLGVVLAASLWLHPWLAGALFVILWAAPKELVIDKDWFGENHGTPDWLDLLFYIIGDLAALGLLALREM
jgi:hypothetical protein